MYDFTTIEAPQKLNRDFILSKIPDSTIFGYYFGPFKLNAVYPSKFRKDKNPSTGFYISKSGNIIYNDLKTTEKLDCFAFICKLYNITFSEAIKRIASDFGLVTGKPTALADKVMVALRNFDKTYKKDTLIHFQADKWNSDNFAYWKQYEITVDELKREGIYPIKKLYINNVFIPNKNNTPRYALTLMHDGVMLVKVYSPDPADTVKWVSNIPLDLPFGIQTLDKKAPFSFGAKAQKDRVVIMKFLPAVYANQNESIASFSPKIIKKLKFYYPKNYLGWDPDETGLTAMGEMYELGFEPAHIHMDIYEQEGIKDFSDLAKEKGLKAVESLLKQYELI